MNIKMKTTNNFNLSLLGTVLLAASIFTSVDAASLTVTNDFVNLQVLSATDLNLNFTETETAVNDNNSRIGTLEAGTANASQTVNCSPQPCISLTTGSTATVNVSSVSVNASTATGRILVIFNGFIECRGIASDNVYVVSQITTSSTAVPNSVNSGGTAARFTLTNSNFTVFTMNMLTSFAVTSSGTKTFFANAKNFTTISPPCNFFSGNMEAVHIP